MKKYMMGKLHIASYSHVGGSFYFFWNQEKLLSKSRFFKGFDALNLFAPLGDRIETTTNFRHFFLKYLESRGLQTIL